MCQIVLSRRYAVENKVVPGHIVVVDLEGTCWVTQPRSLERDIIEVGACVLDTSSGDITRTVDFLVRPSRSRIGTYCQFITGITPERAEGGVEFRHACEVLRTEYGVLMPWAAWGWWDRAQLVAQCSRENVAYPLSSDYTNIKLFAAECFKWKRQKGLGKALTALRMEFQGRKHHAVDDAINEARVLYRAMLQQQ